MVKPQAALLDHTADPLRAVYYAARTCYSADTPQTLWKKQIPKDKMKQLILKTVEAGHHSVLEHASFVFAVSGISRACSHQLVRHRLASFSQQSQRYVKSANQQYVIPPSIALKPGTLKKYKHAVENMYLIYDELSREGVPPEDARFVLPNAIATNVIMTMNLRELMHVSAIRLCTNAQWEIRMLFREIKKLITKKDSFLGGLLKIKCDNLGYCPEFRSCGRYPPRKEVVKKT